MLQSERKIASIIENCSQQIENRCIDYRTEIIRAISEILSHERNHQARHIHIQQCVNARIDDVVEFRIKSRNRSSSE